MTASTSTGAKATRDRALKLLGQGLGTSVVASALGVTDARVSQLLAESGFAEEVQKLRFDSLQKSTSLDAGYTDLEETLLGKLEDVLPLMNKPRDLLQAINVINGAKRRGQDSPDKAAMSAKVVQLSLPPALQQKFVTNVFNQVIEVKDGQGRANSLVTIDSQSLTGIAAELAVQGQELLGAEGSESAGSGESGSSEAEDAGSLLLAEL